MSVEFNCPVCNTTLQAAEADRGRRTRCGGCQSIVTIPPGNSPPGPLPPPSRNPVPPKPIDPAQPAHPRPTLLREPAAPTGTTTPTSVQRRRRRKPAYVPPTPLRTKPQQDDEIDMTPMIDVVFQLLIFFMVTSAYSMQKVLPVPTPETADAAAQQVVPSEDADDVLTVRVDADDVMWVEDVQAIGRQDLIAKLRKARTQPGPAGETPPKKMLVQADPDAHHEAVVTALDAGSIAGMEEVRLATDDDAP